MDNEIYLDSPNEIYLKVSLFDVNGPRLIATSGYRGDWACVLHGVETRRLPRNIKNVLYLVDGEQWWFLVCVNLDDNLLTLYTAAAHDDELVWWSIDKMLKIHQRRREKAMTVNEVGFDAATHNPGITVTSHNMTDVRKEETMCDGCIAQEDQLRHEIQAEAAKLGKRYCHQLNTYMKPVPKTEWTTLPTAVLTRYQVMR